MNIIVENLSVLFKRTFRVFVFLALIFPLIQFPQQTLAQETEDPPPPPPEYNAQKTQVPPPPPSQPNTMILAPIGPGASTQWIPYLCFPNWRCVSAQDNTYVLTGAGNQTDLYDLPDPSPTTIPQGSTITNVTVKAAALGAGLFNIAVRTNGQTNNGTPILISQQIWTPYSRSLVSNPVTGAPWTVDEVNSLQIGVATSVISAPFVNQVWAEVTYTLPAIASTPTPTSTSTISPTSTPVDCSQFNNNYATCRANGCIYKDCLNVCHSALVAVECPLPTNTPMPTTPSPTTSSCPLKSQGDANCDGKVNTDDFNIWRDEFLQVISSKNSDFNNDGIINTDDFNIWRDGFLNSSLPH